MSRRMGFFFSAGFRPFFLGAALWAALAMALWVAFLESEVGLSSHWSAAEWPVHEMLYGYASAVIAGFLLTAVPNWTGIAAPSGGRLAALFLLWCAGRLCVLVSVSLPLSLVALTDLSFLLILNAWLIKTLIKSDNRRNFVVAAFLTLLIIGNGLMYLPGHIEVGQGIGLLALIGLISLIGGRIIPAFTRNWFRQNQIDVAIPSFGLPDKLAIGATLAAMAVLVTDLDGVAIAVLFGLAGVLTLWRLVRWRGWQTASEPLVWVLHLAYLWIPTGFGLLAVALVSSGLAVNSALHGLTTGAIGSMTLAVMCRASLGHSGRPLTADVPTLAIFLLISLSAILRVSTDWLVPWSGFATTLAGYAWCLAFGIFVVTYGPLMFGLRASGATGRSSS